MSDYSNNSDRPVSQRWLIGGIIAMFFILSILYSLVTPLGEGPDEPGHAAYAFFLARTGQLPVQRAAPAAADVPGEGHQPPLAYALVAPFLLWLPADQRQFDLPGNPRFIWAAGDQLNAVAHGSREYLPWQGMVLAWHIARGIGVLLGAGTILCTYLAARTLLADRPPGAALLAALLVALNPQFLFCTAVVNNDALLTMLSALLLALLALVWRRQSEHIPPGPGLISAIGIVAGLALLTKQSAIVLLVPAMAILAWQPGRGRQRVFRCGLALVWMLLLAGWWYIRNLQLYGDLFGLGAF